jgi:hypothetical protein
MSRRRQQEGTARSFLTDLAVGPYGLDVITGVESARSVKDPRAAWMVRPPGQGLNQASSR